MTHTTSPHRGVILFGHGSRDPLWRLPMEAVATQMVASDPSVNVVCAFLELTAPDLPTAVQSMAEDGIRQITVVPMFLGMGKHAREDLPSLITTLRAQYADIDLRLQPAVGENPELVALLARVALSPIS